MALRSFDIPILRTTTISVATSNFERKATHMNLRQRVDAVGTAASHHIVDLKPRSRKAHIADIANHCRSADSPGICLRGVRLTALVLPPSPDSNMRFPG